MELAFVLLFVLLGTGAIVYAGMAKPRRKSGKSSSGDGTVLAGDSGRHTDTDSSGDAGGGDGGGGGGD